MSDIRGAVWIIATGVIIAILYYGRAILTPIALAVFLFLTMEGFARVIDNLSTRIDRTWGRVIAFTTVIVGFAGFMAMLAQSIGDIGSKWPVYETKIDDLLASIYGLLGQSNAPTIGGLLFGEAQTGETPSILAALGSAAASISENLILIILYVVFLYLAQSAWSKKLDNIFTDHTARERAKAVSDAARASIETYLWTQTVISVMITTLTYISLVVLNVPNKLFLVALIFVLNYIPTIGSIIAAFVPFLFTLVLGEADIPGWIPGEYPQSGYVYSGIVFGVVSFWQFSIGNFVQPRMMGDSLNLSGLVVLISLAVWGALWGIAGMFLSAPLTVIIMILCAQSPNARWIAIALSENGEPGTSPSQIKEELHEEIAKDDADLTPA